MATDEINKRNQFKELFEQNYSKLYYVALTFVKDEEDAHDIVSDFFASLWEQYDGDITLYKYGYLYRGVQRRCIDFIRHSKVKDKYSENLLAELKNRLKISIFLWRKKLCISLIFSNFVVSNYKVIYFTLCTTCMQIS